MRPCLLETGRGLTVTFNDRYLYSRFDPAKNAISIAKKTIIPPDTLILCVSPLLGYGLAELLDSIPKSSHVLALEADENLMALSIGAIAQPLLSHPALTYIRTAAVARVIETIDVLHRGPFRRCIRLDFSGGADLHADFYAETLTAVDDYLSRYWRNHLTLMKLGRNYARNIFRNCGILPAASLIPAAQIRLPICVIGAGPSMEKTLPFIRQNREHLFLLSVDTALPSLDDAQISPDAVVLVESQFWIERAFTGFKNSGIPMYADMTARPNAVCATGGPVSYFFSDYAKSNFIDRFARSGFTPPTIPPLGSVGLVALQLARLMAAPGLPIFVTGLDFSWGNGFTHCRGAPAVRETLNTVNRLSPTGNGVPSLQNGIYRVAGKEQLTVFTDPALAGYAQLCADHFGSADAKKTPFRDLGQTGLATGIMPCSEDEATRLCDDYFQTTSDSDRNQPLASGEPIDYGKKNLIRAFLQNEIAGLTRLKELLVGGNGTESNIENREKEIESLVTGMDYLFMHFPDGYKGYSNEKNFLKRVRIELEYFLKTITVALDSIKD